MKLTKQLPTISFEEFKVLIIEVNEFRSFPQLRKYEVKKIDNNSVFFIRKDAKASHLWSFMLTDVYNAYIDLEDFNTISFKKYVPLRHSPARGLLVELKLLKPI